jgi:hypothetical protein
MILAMLGRTVAVTAWTFGAWMAWTAWVICDLRLVLYCQRRYHLPPLAKFMPKSMLDAQEVVFFGSFVVVPATFLLLGLFQRLPGTRGKQRQVER